MMRLRPANILNVALILGLAVLIWFFVQQEIVETSEVEFKVYFQLPDNQNLVVMACSVGKAQNPEKVTLLLRGSKAKLTELLLGEMKELRIPISVKESDIPPDKPYKYTTVITDDMLHLPSNVTLAEKVTADVLVDVLVTRECKVKLNKQADLGDFPTLPNVMVTGPRSVVNDNLAVITERVDATTFRSVKERNLMLLNRVDEYVEGARPDLAMLIDPPTVKVSQPEQKVDLVIEKVPVKLLGPPEFLKRWQVEVYGDMTRTLYITVPKNMESAARQWELELVLDLTSFSYDDPKIPSGPVALKLLNKPDWMELTRVKDESGVEHTITKMEVIITGWTRSNE
jgi:hypothetical protein